MYYMLPRTGALWARHVIIPPAVQQELQDPETPLEVRAWVAHPPAHCPVCTACGLLWYDAPL
jgi:hypothetical protein